MYFSWLTNCTGFRPRGLRRSSLTMILWNSCNFLATRQPAAPGSETRLTNEDAVV